MTKRSESYLQSIPLKHYDLIREGLIILALVVVIVVVLAAVFSSPDYPTVRSEDVAKNQPIVYLSTSANILAGNSSIQDYGRPYTSDKAGAQRLFGLAPANWFGVKTPIDPPQDFVLKPLARVALMNTEVATALQTYESATTEQQQAWLSSYISALDNASVVNGRVQIPSGAYGPVTTMMDGMLALGQAGLLEGALESNTNLPYTTDFTRSLLYFQDDVDSGVAEKLNIQGGQWGVSNETGNYPGAWWLWPYAFWYKIPPMSNSSNADIEAVAIMIALFLILLLLPVLPVLNRLPRWLGVYRLIWRDWYAQKKRDVSDSHQT